MQIFTTKNKIVHYLKKLEKKQIIGFAPTMGALHEGHTSLIKESNKECDVTICSIFINPTQFNSSKDLANYPNTLNKDLELLKKVNCDIVYAPKVSDLYKKDEGAKNYSFGNMANLMEGIHRPGHFNGMATIVEKFFKIIKPSKAFFGEKDIQQLQTNAPHSYQQMHGSGIHCSRLDRCKVHACIEPRAQNTCCCSF